MRIADQEPEPGAPGWMVTYGDMMSLLLTFFILLVSMSEFRKNDKFQGVADSMQKHFGGGRAAAILEEWRPRDAALAAVALLGRAKRQAVLDVGHRSAAEQPTALTLNLPADAASLDEPARAELRSFAERFADDSRLLEIHVSAPTIDTTPASKSRVWVQSFGLAQQAAGLLRDELGISHDRLRLTVGATQSPSAVANAPAPTTQLTLTLLNDTSHPSPPLPSTPPTP